VKLEIKEAELESVEIAKKAIDAASDKQAVDIVLLDMRNLASFVDYFVVCSGESKRQIKAIADEVEQALDKQGVALRHQEGNTESGWILMDFGDVIIHIFTTPEREYYQLERLWSQATPLVRIQ